MSRRARIGLGILSFGAYVVGLATAAISLLLAFAIGPFDGFAATMIVIPGTVGLAGGVGIVRAVERRHRGRAILALVIGAAWAGATAGVLALFASIAQ